MDNKDINDRISKLLSDDKKIPQETDDQLAQRFNKVFAAEPIAKQQNLSYHVPDSAYTDVDDEIARMLQEEDDDDDDDDDLIYGALSSEQDRDLVTEAEEKVSGAQSLFLGPDVGTDESDALIRRIQEENALDSKYETFAKARSDEFESRVHALKKDAPSTDAPSSDERPGGSIPKPLLKEDLHDEMDDWCTLCNEDATVECLGCDHDKYCGRCFYETHQSDMADYDATTHNSQAYAKR